jgi:uncharacterized protein Veg
MVHFRVSFDLHNFNVIYKNRNTDNIQNAKKIKKIMRFYKRLAGVIVCEHNIEIEEIQKQYGDYYQPDIKIKKCTFVFPKMKINKSQVIHMTPRLDIDFKFKISSRSEKYAIKEFKKEMGRQLTVKNNKELHNVYYSTQIIQFTNKLRSYIEKGVYWDLYTYTFPIKTKYVPNITLSNTAVLSLK